MNRKDRRAAASAGRKGVSVAIPQDAYDSYVKGHECHSRGDLEGAKAYYLRAAKGAPHFAGVLLGLGLLALNDGLLDDAEQLLLRAAKVEPRDANIWANLSAVYYQAKKFEQCAETSNAALNLQPDNGEALINLCHAKRELKDIDAAIAAGNRAVEVAPGNGMAYRAYALSLLVSPEAVRTQFDEITSYVDKARKLDDQNSAALDLVFAELLLDRGRFRDVVDLLGRHTAGNDDPAFCRIAAQANFGLQRYDVALTYATRRCELEPQSAQAYERLAKALSNLFRYDEALEALETCIALDPDDYKARLDICQLKQLVCNWDGLPEMQQETVKAMRETESFTGPFHLISMPEPAGSPENQLLAGRLYHGRVEMTGAINKERHPRGKTNERLKIGYLSNDFRDHATAFLMSELIERHDRQLFEISAYCYTIEDGSAFQQRLRRGFDRFVDVNLMSIEETAKKINDDGIDILVDLKGFTQGSRTNVLAHRAAPIQVNYLGFPGTLGADHIDYIVGDPFVTPFQSAEYYSEKIVQLPNCYQPNDSKRPVPNLTISRAQAGLPDNAFIFASFNNPNKLTPEVFSIWARLLHSVPGSILLMYAAMPEIRKNVLNEAQSLGISEDRIVFAGFTDVATHISRMRLADLFLDCFPCTAHTTASEAVWAGLPLLTCAGRTFASRVAGSILTAAGLPDLVTSSLEEYEASALQLARDPGRLSAVRRRVEHASSTPLFDIATYTRDLERAYLRMAEIYDAGDDPQPIEVSKLPELEPLPVINESKPMRPALNAVAVNAVPQPATEARVAYEACPLCFGDNRIAVGSADCTAHALYKSNLPGTIDWLLCQDCRHVHASGFFGEEALGTIYATTPAAEFAGHDVESRRVAAGKAVQRVARMAKSGIWLDVGCGDGSIVFAADEWGYRAVGLDIRTDNVEAMRKLGYAAEEACIELYEPEEKCSVVSMINLLQHVPFPGSAVERASNLLKPGGILFLTLPNMNSVVWRKLDLERKNPFWSDLEIYHHFTRERAYQMLVQSGLLPIEYGISEEHPASMEIIAIKPTEG